MKTNKQNTLNLPKLLDLSLSLAFWISLSLSLAFRISLSLSFAFLLASPRSGPFFEELCISIGNQWDLGSIGPDNLQRNGLIDIILAG